MPERRFETSYWSDPFIINLPAKAKLIYIYLWTNIHCNQAGLYEIAPETICFETGLPLEEFIQLIPMLEPKVCWYPEHNLIWVKNFLRRQTRSPQFLVAAAKCLEAIKKNGLVKEFLDYNYTLSIPYQYPIDGVEVFDSDTLPPSNTSSKSRTEGLGVVKGEGESATPATETAMESRKAPTKLYQEFLSFLETLEGWRIGRADDLAWLREFLYEYPEFSISLAKACRDYHSGKPPPKNKGPWRKRFREWMIHDRKFKAEKGKSGLQPGRVPTEEELDAQERKRGLR